MAAAGKSRVKKAPKKTGVGRGRNFGRKEEEAGRKIKRGLLFKVENVLPAKVPPPRFFFKRKGVKSPPFPPTEKKIA